MPTRTKFPDSIRLFAVRSAPTCLLMALTLTITATITGCGGEAGLASVKGRVTYKGQPVTTGEIFFTPDEPGKRGAKGAIGSDGYYTLSTFGNGDGAYTGKHKVSVVAQGPDKPIPPKMKNRMLEEDMQGTGDPLVPKKYFSAQSSGLTAEVADGKSNVIDFDLKD